MTSMRISIPRYNGQACVAGVLICLSGLVCAGEAFYVESEDVVAIRAEAAWEDSEPETIHFSGDFEMRVRDWRLTADNATLQGRLEDPEMVTIEGSPARLDLVRHTDHGPETVQAEAARVTYQRAGNRIRLDGFARLIQGESVLYSNHIEYEPDTDRLRASGETGVRIDLQGETDLQ